MVIEMIKKHIRAKFYLSCNFFCTVMQIEKALMNDFLHVLKVSWKFRIPTIYNFAVIYGWNFAIFLKSSLLLTVSIVFSVYIKTLRLNNLKSRTAMNAKILVVICVEVIIDLLLYNLHDCIFKGGLSGRMTWQFLNA